MRLGDKRVSPDAVDSTLTSRRPLPTTLACATVALSGVIHLGITSEHSLHAPAHGLFFATLGVFQIGWAAAYWIVPRRWLRWAGFVLSGGMIVLWGVTRFLPAPFAGHPEEIDLAGLVSKALETIALMSLMVEEGPQRSPFAQQARLILGGLLIAVISGLGAYASALALEPFAPPLLAAQDEAAAGEPSTAEHAHAGTRRIQLDEAPAGPYLVRAVTAFGADPVQSLALEVRLIDSNSRRTLTDAEVWILAESAAGGDRVVTAAVQGEAKIPRDYGARLDLPEAGAWRISIFIDSALGQAQAEFDLFAPSGSGAGGWIGAYLPFGGLLLLIVAYVMLNRSGRSGEATID